MKNVWKLAGGVLIVIFTIIILRDKTKKDYLFIRKTEREIMNIDSSQTHFFNIVDEVVDSINSQKERNLKLMDVLNFQLKGKNTIINNNKYTLEEKLLIVEELKVKCKENQALIKSLNLRIKKYKNSNLDLKNINNSLYKKIKYLSSPQYVSDTIFDTIYQIDTILYPKHQIKVLKQKKKWLRKSKKTSSPSL